MKPFAESCAENQDPILAVLRELFSDRKNVLEIASGTGQHAVHFGRALTHLTWQTSDLAQCHDGIRAWLDEAGLPNVQQPIVLDVNGPWPETRFDAVFNANTVHIVSWPEVEKMFAGIGGILEPGGILCLYGPFNYHGAFTSESNARFDAWLKSRDPKSGVRDFEALDRLASAQGLRLLADLAMPVNNRALAWKKPG